MDLVNEKGETALFIACKKGNKEIAELLLAVNADVNKANKEGYSPVLIASHSGDPEMVKLLLTNKVCLYKNNLIYVQGYYF